MRESLEQTLEKERVKILRNAVVTVQKHVRGYLARKKFTNQVASAITIQTAFRGYRDRYQYQALRHSTIQIQAQWRMRKQRRAYHRVSLFFFYLLFCPIVFCTVHVL